jgi:uncharacterized protein YkwD
VHPSHSRIGLLLALALAATAIAAPAAAHTLRARPARHCAAAARRPATAARACHKRKSHTGAHHARHTKAARKLSTSARTHPRGGVRGAATHGGRRRTPTVEEDEEAQAERTAAEIAAVLAAACANTTLSPEAGNLALVRAAVLCLINHKRAEHGERPLILNADLQAAAESHASELVADDYFAHVSPSGLTPFERIRDTGYVPSAEDGYVLGENLAWGTYEYSTPQAIAEAWFNSPPHLANILETQYRETGIGVSAAVPSSLGEGEPGGTYAQEFGVILP